MILLYIYLYFTELILGVVKGTEIVLAYISKNRDNKSRMRAASTSFCSDIGDLILTHICPAVHAILQDGLKPYTRSLFGQVWNFIIEETVCCTQDPTDLFCSPIGFTFFPFDDF